MVIAKILNNSAIIASQDGTEYVLLGKGIGFNAKIGHDVNLDLIENKFEKVGHITFSELANFISNISDKYVEVVNKILKIAKVENNPVEYLNLYYNLITHIHFAIERKIRNIPIINSIFYQVKHFYPEEYNCGVVAIKIIKDIFDLDLDLEEASFIAMHIVNASTSNDKNNIIKMTETIWNIIKIVEYNLDLKINFEDYDTQTFVGHLRSFFITSMKEPNKKNSSKFIDIHSWIHSTDSQVYDCAIKVKNYIAHESKISMTDDDLSFLMIHIKKLNSNY